VRRRRVTSPRVRSSITARTEDWKPGQVHDAMPRSEPVDSPRFWARRRFVKWTDLTPLPPPSPPPPRPCAIHSSTSQSTKTDKPQGLEAVTMQNPSHAELRRARRDGLPSSVATSANGHQTVTRPPAFQRSTLRVNQFPFSSHRRRLRRTRNPRPLTSSRLRVRFQRIRACRVCRPAGAGDPYSHGTHG
jgi:hypothetical protein